MGEPGFTLDVVRRVWDDKHGDRIEVGEDSDGLGLLAIRSVGQDDRVQQEITFASAVEARMVGTAILEACRENEAVTP